MKQSKFRHRFALWASLTCLSLGMVGTTIFAATSCGGDDKKQDVPTNNTSPNNPQPQGLVSVDINLDKPSYIEGDTITATAYSYPPNLQGVEYKWSIEGSNTIIPSTSNVATFKASTQLNGKKLKVVATYNQKSVTDIVLLSVSSKPTTPTLPEIKGVQLIVQTDETIAGQTKDYIASVSPSSINTNLKYEWIIVDSSNKETIYSTSYNKDNFCHLVLTQDMDGKKFKVRVTQTLPAPQSSITLTSNEDTIVVHTPSNPDTVDWAEKLNEEKNKLANAKINNIVLTQQQVDNLKHDDQQEYENIFISQNLYNAEFAYEFSMVNSTSNSIIANVIIYPPEEAGDIPEVQTEITINFVIQGSSGGQVSNVVQKAVEDLNAFNWNNFNYSKMGTRRFIEINDNQNSTDTYFLNYVNNFDKRKFEVDHSNVNVSLSPNSFKKDLFNQSIRFKLDVSKDGETATTNELLIKYTTPDSMLGELDKSAIDPQVKVSQSFRGILAKLPTPIKPLSYSLFETRFNNLFNSTDAQFKQQMKLYEMLYQLRFIMYQTYGDNATSMDYGLDGQSVILKAKIKDSINVSNSLIQIADKQTNNFTMNANNILTLKISGNINDSWSSSSNDDGLFAASSFMYTKGPEYSTITSGPNFKSYVLTLSGSSWNFSSTQNGSSLHSYVFSNRIPFIFSLGYKRNS